jgi:hypothetical protein
MRAGQAKLLAQKLNQKGVGFDLGVNGLAIAMLVSLWVVRAWPAPPIPIMTTARDRPRRGTAAWLRRLFRDIGAAGFAPSTRRDERIAATGSNS